MAVVAPSHAPPEAGLQRGLERLRSFGLEPRVYETATRETEWLRAHPAERAADIHGAFRDDDVTGVVAAMGGNAAHRLFDHLDPGVFRENPKRFFGSSDNTHVHVALTAAGLVSFYGVQLFPDLAADPEVHPYTREYAERALRATPFGPVAPASEWTDEYYDVEEGTERTWFEAEGWRWHGPERVARGPVVGGCFEMLETQLMLASEQFDAVALDGGVLAIETSGETPHPEEVERFLAALGERGWLSGLAGLLVGKPETPGETRSGRERYRRRQRERIAGTVEQYADVPVVFDLDFGHTAPVLPLPLGAAVELDAERRTIRFRVPDEEGTRRQR